MSKEKTYPSYLQFTIKERFELWEHLNEEHGLILLESELDDIIGLAEKCTICKCQVPYLDDSPEPRCKVCGLKYLKT